MSAAWARLVWRSGSLPRRSRRSLRWSSWTSRAWSKTTRSPRRSRSRSARGTDRAPPRGRRLVEQPTPPAAAGQLRARRRAAGESQAGGHPHGPTRGTSTCSVGSTSSHPTAPSLIPPRHQSPTATPRCTGSASTPTTWASTRHDCSPLAGARRRTGRGRGAAHGGPGRPRPPRDAAPLPDARRPDDHGTSEPTRTGSSPT